MKMAAKHTPGPWSIYDRREVCDEIWIGVEDANGFEVTHAALRYGCEEAEELGDIEANARLIASAPALLAALKLFVTGMDRAGDGPDDSDMAQAMREMREAYTKARAAIRQAEGGE